MRLDQRPRVSRFLAEAFEAAMRGAVEDHLGRMPEADRLLELIEEELERR